MLRRLKLRSMLKGACVLGWVSSGSLITAQAPVSTANPVAINSQTQTRPAPASATFVSVSSPGVVCVGGQLKIDVVNATLAEVLNKVAVVTGVKIDAPAEASSERMPVLKLGPGSAREILASLLRDTHFNYLIQDSDTDPDKIQSVLIMPAEKNTTPDGPAPAQSPYRRGGGRPPEQVARSEEAPSQPGSEPVRESAVNPPPASPVPDPSGAPSPNPSEQPGAPITPAGFSDATRTNGTSPAQLSPPPVLSQQNISQQLQQMYQQRMQMVQQSRETAAPTGPASQGNN
jgi:hypothetical protein